MLGEGEVRRESSPRASIRQRLRLQAEDAAEAGDEQAFRDAEAVETEIAEAGIHAGLRMNREIARLVAGLVGRDPHLSNKREARAGQRFLQLQRAVHQERGARIALQVPGMVGEVREQQDDLALRAERREDQRDEGVEPAIALERLN